MGCEGKGWFVDNPKMISIPRETEKWGRENEICLLWQLWGTAGTSKWSKWRAQAIQAGIPVKAHVSGAIVIFRQIRGFLTERCLALAISGVVERECGLGKMWEILSRIEPVVTDTRFCTYTSSPAVTHLKSTGCALRSSEGLQFHCSRRRFW